MLFAVRVCTVVCLIEQAKQTMYAIAGSAFWYEKKTVDHP